MSIIVRLQNLPESAKSGDIRKFFGGLRIPDGGVHILGGEKGDAFINFCSDEDARLALRKDGGKIKDGHVRLFLSSRMEMQHEVEKITKHNLFRTPHKSFSQEKMIENETSWRRSSEKTQRRFSRSRSPQYVECTDDGKFKNFIQPHERSRSPVEKIAYNSRSSSSKYRTYSPRRSRSPEHSLPPKSRAVHHRRRSISPETHHYVHSPQQMEFSYNKDSESSNLPAPQHEIQAELERRITEAMNANPLNKSGNVHGFLTSDGNAGRVHLRTPESYLNQPAAMNIANDMHSLFPPVMNPGSGLHGVLDRNRLEIPPYIYNPETSARCCEMERYDEFYIIMSGLDPRWNFKEVQLILKGIFAPQPNIKWEFDNKGFKTGTAFIKLTNREDFNNILSSATFMFNGHRIMVSECPKFLSHSNFHSGNKFQNDQNVPQNRDFCYIVKGLPFSCTFDDIVEFFHGFEVADALIYYDKDGRATGTGFVSFTNWKDFEEAFVKNGKKIGHRYIEMLPSSDGELAEAKTLNPNLPSFSSYCRFQSRRNLPASKRPICAVLTGLPWITTAKKIALFFSESGLKPDAIHIIMNKKKQCDGRAFVEFTNFLDFESVLKFHGKQFYGNIICVKQVLFDEMNNILASQKAKHHYATQAPIGSSLNLPDKVPYLWEPPDAAQDKEKDIFTASTPNKWINYSRNQVHNPNYNFQNEMLRNDMRHSITHNPFSGGNFNKYLQNKTATIGDLNSQYKQEKLNREMENFIVENELNVLFRKTVFSDDSREPVKFNISNKQPFENTKTDETFSQARFVEEAFRLTKLSPEKDIRPPKQHKKDEKFFPDKKYKHLDSMKSSGRKHFDQVKLQEENISKSRNDLYPRSRNNKESKQHTDQSESHHKSPVHSTSLHSARERKSKEDASGCIVELSNVSSSVKTEDLIHFLKGFDFYKDTLIRRYTTEGEPTNDVRVTFSSCREAGKAIRALNKSKLKGKEIVMFMA